MRKVILLLLPLFLLHCAGAGAYCAEKSIHVNGFSKHFGGDEYNQFNPGMGFSCGYASNKRWSADWFIDSNEDASFMVGHEWDLWSGKRFAAGITAGAGHRKDVAESYNMDVFPFALPYLSYSHNRMSVRGFFLPQIKDGNDDAVAIQIRIAI